MNLFATSIRVSFYALNTGITCFYLFPYFLASLLSRCDNRYFFSFLSFTVFTFVTKVLLSCIDCAVNVLTRCFGRSLHDYIKNLSEGTFQFVIGHHWCDLNLRSLRGKYDLSSDVCLKSWKLIARGGGVSLKKNIMETFWWPKRSLRNPNDVNFWKPSFSSLLKDHSTICTEGGEEWKKSSAML